MPRSRTYLLIAAFGTLCLIMYWAIGNPFDPFDNSSFSPKRWRNTDPEGRAGMARSAVDQILPGTPEAQVISMLGGTDDVRLGELGAGHSIHTDRTLAYYLGQHSAYGFDDAFIFVHFDPSGRVRSAEVDGY